MRKLNPTALARSVAARVVHPGHLLRAVKLHRGRRRTKRAYDDAQLAVLAQLVPGGFLHYGYFDDADRRPEDVSLSEVAAAQLRYAEVLLEHAGDKSLPVLDVGCGMGGLVGLLLARGFAPVALTPDRLQAEHVRRAYPGVPVVHSRFEDLPDPASHAGAYGTVFTSESLQYLNLDRALPLIARVLAPGGSWVACDYFRHGDAEPAAAGAGRGGKRSGHDWDGFRRRLDAEGWAVAYERDITPQVLPTLRVAHLWANGLGVPLLRFSLLKLRSKHPAVHYLLEDVLDALDGVVEDNLRLIDPATFASNRRYALLVMRRTA